MCYFENTARIQEIEETVETVETVEITSFFTRMKQRSISLIKMNRIYLDSVESPSQTFYVEKVRKLTESYCKR